MKHLWALNCVVVHRVLIVHLLDPFGLVKETEIVHSHEIVGEQTRRRGFILMLECFPVFLFLCDEERIGRKLCGVSFGNRRVLTGDDLPTSISFHPYVRKPAGNGGMSAAFRPTHGIVPYSDGALPIDTYLNIVKGCSVVFRLMSGISLLSTNATILVDINPIISKNAVRESAIVV